MAYKKFNFDEFASDEFKRLRNEEIMKQNKEHESKFVKNILWSVKFYAIGIVILVLIKFIIGIILLLIN